MLKIKFEELNQVIKVLFKKLIFNKFKMTNSKKDDIHSAELRNKLSKSKTVS